MAWQVKRPAARGVTLLEMVVVLGLIALLAAIVVPVFRGVEYRQRRTTCVANLRAIGEALIMYRDDYRAFPPDATEAWGSHHALGLYYLNYLSVPNDAKPAGVVYSTAASNYLRDETRLHCPANPVGKPTWTSGADDAAYLGGYNAYDWNYRRDWDAYLKSLGGEFAGGWPEMGNRHLKQAFAPDTTVVTWCTMHRNAQPTSTREGLEWDPEARERDVVLYVDGTVEALPASKTQYATRRP